MFPMRKIVGSAGLALLLALSSALLVMLPQMAAASEIKYVVDGVPVTTYDIQRRAAFLRLQRKGGNLNSLAAEEMVAQTLRLGEMKRRNIAITDEAVDSAYARFASNNGMSLAQLDGILSQSGVTKSHFREYIRTQMGWGQLLSSRYRTQGRISEQEAVKRMLEQGGAKPTATEYMLQHVIFVIPQAERSASLGKRKREAESMRSRFTGCEQTREFAKGLLDVTVRDLGRVLAPQLPTEWADQIKGTKVGGATPVRETDRGVEFIGVCSSREISDDRVAQMVFQNEEAGTEENSASEEMSKKYLDELRAKATIVER